MARRRTLVLVGAAMAALVLGIAGVAWAQEGGGRCTPGTGDTDTVVLDPGHGGTDTGATYTFPPASPYYNHILKESDQALIVASDLQSLLVADGYRVCMTRTGDVNLSNRDRYTFANTTGAKLLVSIHMNGSSDPTVDYTTTLYGKWQKDKAFAYAVFGDLQANPPYGLVTLPAAKPNDPNTLLDGKKPYSFASGVLLKSNMPATIAETVFITNPYEAAWLADPSGERQLQIAHNVEEGILTYLQTH